MAAMMEKSHIGIQTRTVTPMFLPGNNFGSFWCVLDILDSRTKLDV